MNMSAIFIAHKQFPLTQFLPAIWAVSTRKQSNVAFLQSSTRIRKLIYQRWIFFPWFNSPPVGHGLLIIQDSRSYSDTHTSVGRTPLDEWSTRRRDLWQHTTLTRYKHPCPQWDSNPQSHQASGFNPTPQTARRPGPTLQLTQCYGRCWVQAETSHLLNLSGPLDKRIISYAYKLLLNFRLIYC